jgi:hypothetical protein
MEEGPSSRSASPRSRPQVRSHASRSPRGLGLIQLSRIIPKKLVKGNEEQVFDEMQVLKDLDHPNIVSRQVAFRVGNGLCSLNSLFASLGEGVRPLRI